MIVVNQLSKWWWAISGETWSLNQIYASTPGLIWNRNARRIEGKADAIEAFISKARTNSADIVGNPPTLPSNGRALRADGATTLQLEGINWLAEGGSDGRILGDPTGGGKSLQASLGARLSVPGKRKLIVCPAHLRSNWLAELAKWIPGATAVSLKRAKSTDAEWVIVSYEGLPFVQELGEFGAIIFDEVHYVKNFSSKNRGSARAKLAAEIAHRIPWRVGLSATPVWNRRRDLWGVAEIIRPGGLGTFWQFAKHYLHAQQGEYGWDFDGPYPEDPAYQEITAELAQRMRWFFLRREEITSELTDGKTFRHIVRWCGQSNRRALNELQSQVDWSEGGLSTRVAIDNALRHSAGEKREAAKELATELLGEGFGVAIWTYTRDDAKFIGQSLSVPIITGAIEADERVKALELARPKNCFVATMDSLKEGVNIPWVSQMVFADLDWSPPKLQQVLGRAMRRGQTTNVTAWWLGACGTIDEIILPTIVEKLKSWVDLSGDNNAKSLADGLRGESDDDILTALAAKLSRPDEWLELSEGD